MGYVEDNKGYWLWNLNGRKISIASNLEFDESTATNELIQSKLSNDPQQYLHVTVGVGKQVIQKTIPDVAHETNPSSDVVGSNNHLRDGSRVGDGTNQMEVLKHDLN